MRLAAELVSPPDVLPLSLDEVKLHCRVDGDDEDDLLNALIAAAVGFLDGRSGILGRCMISQTWRERFDPWSPDRRHLHGDRYWPGYDVLPLSLAPVIEISSVTYADVSGVEQTIDPASYSLEVDSLGPRVRFARGYSFPAMGWDGAPLSVTYVAGYGEDPDDVPSALRQAMKLLIGDWYLNRETMVEGRLAQLPFAVDALLGPYLRAVY
jgi:uncharacterized phiE125 gp8 family phage protein